jgi:hypothetical protein
MTRTRAKQSAQTAPQARQERPHTARATKQPTSTKRAPKAALCAKDSLPTSTARASERATVLMMLQREGGASLGEIMTATGWLRHTVRGFLSVLGSKGGHQVTAADREDGVRMYSAK